MTATLTHRLALTPVSRDMRLAMQASPRAFADLLGLRLPGGWPEFPEAFSLDQPESPPPWSGYLFGTHDGCVLVGNGGFVAPPDASGTVEIGYEIAPAFRGQGYATEAAAGLVAIARSAGARAVIAHSLPSPNASNAVMRRLGMRFAGAQGAGDMSVWRWRLDLPPAGPGEP